MFVAKMLARAACNTGKLQGARMNQSALVLLTRSLSDANLTKPANVNSTELSVEPSSGISPNQVNTTNEVDKLYRRIEIEARGHDPAVLRSYKLFLLETAKRLEIPVEKTWEPFPVHDRRNMLKSAFGHKKHILHYEARTYYQVILLEKLTGSTADTYLEYIERNVPEGVGMKITKHEIKPLPEHLRQRPSLSPDQD